MKNRHFSFVIIFLFVMFILFFTNLYAVENDSNIDEEEKKLRLEQKEDVINNINELTLKIRKKVNEIDKKIENLQQLEEYNKYPAIRLNIDTPMFGLKSMVEQKLQIIRGVSTTDIANGYSIRDILSSGKVKITDSQIAGITVSTKDVTLDENIDFLDANIVILRLTEYLEQLDTVDEFIDKQINKFFYGYIDKQKKESVKNTLYRLDELDKRLNEIDNKLTYLYILGEDEQKYSEFVEKYNKISDNLRENRIALNDILISNTKVEKILRDVVTLEAKLLDFSGDINTEYDYLMQNIQLEKSLSKIKGDMESRKNRIQKYIKNSTEKIEKEVLDDNIDEESKDNKEIIYESKIKYGVVSEDTINYLNSIINSVESRLNEYSDKSNNYDEISIEEIANKGEVNGINVVEPTLEEKQKVIEELKGLYSEFLVRENKFYLDNVNYLLKDTSAKLSSLAKNTDSNVVNAIKYVYLDLPQRLNDCLTTNNLNLRLELIYVIDELNNNILALANYNTTITELYSKKIS